MPEKSIVEQIKHYQRDIVKCPENSQRMIRCIERLTVLPVTISHLQETGVGRSVNELRKCGGEVGAAANALVCKWKSMVQAEEESEEESEGSVEDQKYSSSQPEPVQRNSSSYIKSVSQEKTKPLQSSENSRKSNSSPSKTESSHSGSKTSKSSDHKHSSRSDHKTSSEKSDKNRHSSSSGSKNGDSKHTNSKHNDERRDSKSSDIKHSDSRHHSSNHSSSRSSKSDHESRTQKKPTSSQRSEVSCNGSIKSDKSSKKEDDQTKSSKYKSDTSIQDGSKRHKDEKEKHKSNERSHKSSSSKKYDLKRIDSESDEDMYKPSRPNKKPKTSYSDEDKTYENDKRSKESVKRSYKNSSEESESEEENKYDIKGESESPNMSEAEMSRRDSSEDNSSEDERVDANDSVAGTSESDEDRNSKPDSSENESDESSEREEYVPVKIKKEKESPPRYVKSDSHEKNKPNHVKSKHNSTSDLKNSIRKEKESGDIKIKKEKQEKDYKSSKKEEKHVDDRKHSKSNKSKHESSHSSKENEKSDKKVKVKIEKKEDGSIDCESGASFADALGLSDTKKKTVKRKLKSPSQDNHSRSVEKSSHSKPEISSKSESRSLSTSSSSKNKSASSSSSTSFKEPDLLSKNVKLEPLDVDLNSTLPEITPNYKPLPHFSPPSSPHNKRPKTMSQEDALSSIMSNKVQRTKVYSGNKSGYLKVPSLFDLCIQVLRENIEALEYTGGVPYDLLKPVLDRATADQLYQLEHYNPYLIEDTDVLWQFHCSKEFRGKKPDEFETWRELYLRLLDERERKLQALKENITQSMAKSTPIRQTKLAYVDAVVKPPRNIARKQMKFGTGKATKHDLVSRAMVGAASSSPAPEAVKVPPPPAPRANLNNSFPIPNFLKKKKAPLMAKTLQLIKGNRFKR